MDSLSQLYPRHIAPRISEALTDTPVVMVVGPRQAGKTTLVRELTGPERKYFTLDDALTLLSAKEDPVGMIRGLGSAVIDEIQRAPELLLAIKKSVDEDRHPGRFLLTGSANLMTLPTVADSLAGRMECLTLLPLSQGELHGNSTNWLDEVFAGRLPTVLEPVIGNDLVDTVLRGGYPEAISRTSQRRRTAWGRQYLDAIIQRDVRDVASVDQFDQLPRFLKALAHVSGQMCNYTKLGSQMSLDHKTASRYIGIFEQMFLLKRIDVWSSNRLKRMVKTPKLQFIDSGLLATLIGLTAETAIQNRSLFGNVLETFVYAELLKHAMNSEDSYQLYYYRDHDQYEVDVVAENAAGQIAGVEIKAAATIRESDLRGLKRLMNAAEDYFTLGIILYDGTETLPLGDRLWAAPISTLWGG